MRQAKAGDADGGRHPRQHVKKQGGHRAAIATRSDFWAEKLGSNVTRDANARKRLRQSGWRVLVIWECETKHAVKLKDKLARFLSGGRTN
jgi:G:T-mismatch repair DNA endonuclease (very short patch repair protein)